MARPKQNPTEKATPTTTSKKKLSLNEFRAWLSGVEEMQDESWTPSATQWRTIRAKIEEVMDVPVQQQQRTRYVDEGYDERPSGPIRPSGPSAFSAPQPMQQQAPAPVPGMDGKIKTANIDTSKTPYVAAFE